MPKKQKSLHNKDVESAKKNVKDIQVVGNGDMFQLPCKASSESEGWMKSTKAMETVSGVVLQVSTQQKNMFLQKTITTTGVEGEESLTEELVFDGTYEISEDICFVPNVKIVDDVNGGKKLVPLIDPVEK